MRCAIMQPYFFPYIGYFQLINAVDRFVIYDNIKFSKKGWVKHNRILNGNEASLISVSIKRASDYFMIGDIKISENYDHNKLLRRIYNAYRNAPYFDRTYTFLNKVLPPSSKSLFSYLNATLQETCKYLGIKTPFMISSNIQIDHTLRSQSKVIALCEALDAREYINLSGGEELYQSNDFRQRGIELKFLLPNNIFYDQFKDRFMPNLSIIDVMMFNSQEMIRHMLNNIQFKNNDAYVAQEQHQYA
jgi:hypothetical protein